ncbi:hypothetical protein Tco_1171152 [Tanacetum coccineum]
MGSLLERAVLIFQPNYIWEHNVINQNLTYVVEQFEAMSLLTPSDIQHSAANPDLRVLQIGIRAKVIENQPCLLHHPLLPKLLSTLILSQAESSGEPMRRYLTEDKDEREPMFIQPHDPDYVLEPIYPKYIPLKDEHVFLVEEQPLPPVDSPTAESPGYVNESDPKEDPEEYEDDKTEDGPNDLP